MQSVTLEAVSAMKTLQHFFRGLFVPEQGAAAVEYALLIAGIAAMIAVSVGTLGSAVAGFYQMAIDCFPK
jgi:Flp pilus assembly pilin Flp